jgi:hypothetical protein
MSPWDAKESLPRAYGRLFDLGNFKATQRRVLERDLASAKKAEQANLRKLLLPSSSSSSNVAVVGATSFSLPSTTAGATSGGGGGGDLYDMEGDETGEGRLISESHVSGNMLDQDQVFENEGNDNSKNEPRADGWISSGSYVTLLLGAVADQLMNTENDASSSSNTLNMTFLKDMANFTAIVEAHQSLLSCAPMSFHALHRHENRLTCIHANIQRASSQLLDPGNKTKQKKGIRG